MATGTTFKELSGAKAAQLPLLIAPLSEQKRIADKLGSLLERVNACRVHLDRVPQILKRFRQSVLVAAMTGELTEKWREEHNIGETWELCSLGSVIADIRYGTAKKSDYEPSDGVPVLRIPNIGDRKILSNDIKFAYFDQKEVDALSLKTDDLLLVRSNGSVQLVGKVAVVDREFEGFLFAGYLIRLRFDTTRASPRFISLYLSSPAARNYIEHTARSTSGINNINSNEVKSVVTP